MQRAEETTHGGAQRCECIRKGRAEALQALRCPDAAQLAHDQANVESAHLDEQPFQNVPASAQVPQAPDASARPSSW